MEQVQAVRLNIISEATRLPEIQSDQKTIVDTRIKDDLQGQWKQCLSLIEKELPWQTFQTWFLPIVPVSCEDRELVLKVPSRFFHEWLDAHHGDLVKRVSGEIFGDKTKIKFTIAAVSNEKSEMSPVSEPVKQVSEVIVNIDRNIFEEYNEVNRRYKFSTFFYGNENELAKKAAEYVAENLGNAEYNPLYIYGKTGTGKTHLMHAVGNYIHENHDPRFQIVMSSERFLHDYVYALQNGKMQKFVSSAIQANIFLLDDVQFLSSKIKSQEGLLFVLSELVKGGGQVIINANVPPNQLNNFNSRLISFFQKGLIVDLPSADYRTREKIVRSHLNMNNLRLDEKIIHYLAENLTQNMHYLNSVMVRIIAQMSLLKKELNLEEVRYITSQMYPQLGAESVAHPIRKSMDIKDIVKVTSEFFDVPLDMLQGVSRKRKIMKARQIAIYLSRELTNDSLNSIGYHFSNLHHASVLYSYNKIKKMLKSSPTLKSAVQKIQSKLDIG